MIRGVRGAICVEENSREAIVQKTRKLLQDILKQNQIELVDIAGVWLTTTADLTAEYPAVAARELGWQEVPLLCGHEMDVPHGLAKTIRIMLLCNTEKSQADIQHVYLDGAEVLRPDWRR